MADSRLDCVESYRRAANQLRDIAHTDQGLRLVKTSDLFSAADMFEYLADEVERLRCSRATPAKKEE